MPASSIGSVVLVANTPAQLVGSNPRRKRLTLSWQSATVALFIGTDSGVSATNGFVLIGNAGLLVLTEEEHGDLVKGPFWGVSTLAQPVGIIDTTA